MATCAARAQNDQTRPKTPLTSLNQPRGTGRHSRPPGQFRTNPGAPDTPVRWLTRLASRHNPVPARTAVPLDDMTPHVAYDSGRILGGAAAVTTDRAIGWSCRLLLSALTSARVYLERPG